MGKREGREMGEGGRREGGRGGRVGWWVKIKAHGISFGGSQNFVFFTFFYFSKIMSNNLKHTTYF